MTAELEEQQEKPKEEKLEEKIQDADDEKIQEVEEQENPKNGADKNDLAKPEEVVEVEVQDTDGGQEDEEAAAAPKRRGFFGGLFKKSKKRQDLKDDAEAGTELLAKDGKIEIKESEGKAEKNDTGTDVTVPISDDGTGEGGDAPNGKTKEEDKKVAKPYWRRVGIGLLIIVLILTAISVISILTASGESPRGPMMEPLVVTDCGPLKGYIQDDVYVFQGIPYAMPPTGEHRWKPPRSPSTLDECWSDTYEAVNATPYCYQKPIPNLDLQMSEDCLHLDVITPSLSPSKPRPVVVYIPGDHPLQGFGAADVQWKPSTTLADEKDVIFVTIKYRTGVFGFMVLDLLTNSVRPPTSGNYGIMDIIAALKWVQRNIRSFGGDPQKVTVLAHGGGATATLSLLASKKGEGLFSKVWLTAPSVHFSNKTLAEIGEDNSVFLKKLNCETVDCLHNKTAEDIILATPGFWATDWASEIPSGEEEQSPVMSAIDGNVVYDTPLNMWKSGDIHHVPVVIGTAAQESGSSNLLPDLNSWSWTDFSDFVSEKIGAISTNLTVAAIEFYIRNSSTPAQQFHSMVSDIRTICPIERLTEDLNEALEKDVYWYVVNYIPSSPIRFSNDTAAVSLSVHGLDIAAIFGRLHQYINPMSPADVKFQRNVQDLFYSFVYKGAPEISQEVLMSSGFVNVIGNQIQSRMTPYESCHLWNNEDMYPTYAKMN